MVLLLVVVLVVVLVMVLALMVLVVVVVLLTLSRPQSQHAPPRASQPPRATTPVSPAHAHNTNTATETHTDRHVDTHPTETKRFCSHVFSQCSMLSSSFSSNCRVSFAENTIDQYQIQASGCNRESHFGCFCCEYVWSILLFFIAPRLQRSSPPVTPPQLICRCRPTRLVRFVSFRFVRFATELYSAQNEITLS